MLALLMKERAGEHQMINTQVGHMFGVKSHRNAGCTMFG